jgi:hypothetical protein
MIQLMHEGRERIKEVEALYLLEEANSYDKADYLHFERDDGDPELSRLADSLLLGSIPNLVVSPLAAYVSKFVSCGHTVAQIAADAKVDIPSTREALEEIQDRTFAILLDKDRVDCSDLEFIRQSKAFRYEVTTQ